MSDTFSLNGSWESNPSGGCFTECGAPALEASFCESMYLAQREIVQYTLIADSVQAVSFGGVTDANVAIITSNRKVKVRLTSADGATQSVPCDGTMILISKTVPFTAIDLTRVAGTDTRVRIFLGEKQ